MATTRNASFQTMLNEYLPNRLLSDELIKRDYILNRVTKDLNAKGSKIVVPFKANGATNVRVGGLTASANIGQSQKVRGEIDTLTEFWGSLVFNHSDITDHSGKIPESTFLSVMKDEVDDFSQFMKEQVSNQLGTGPILCNATAVSTNDVTIDRIERLQLNQEVEYDVAGTATSAYVKTIDMNTSKATFSATRSTAGIAATVASAATLDIGATQAFYIPGVLTDGAGSCTVSSCTSVRNALLSNAEGGALNIHGKAKTLYPFLQSINIDGADGSLITAVTSANILDSIFNGWVQVNLKGRGTADEVLVSWKHLAWIMTQLEDIKGAYKVTKDPVASLYGWTEIEIMALGNGKNLKIVGIQEWDDDLIAFMDWSHITMRSNGGFQKRKAPDGREYFEERAATGYRYIVDTSISLEMEYRKPSTCGLIHSIA